ncbi:LacI family DNA-binding transcriptional regulator [[Haemophilus] felis]|uniref:Transcriptional regulator n=1 Tax=[Haemophilus] felis TaxID=123822 RepID=A0A1T0BBC5_9PAST|nr:LacI family DNA-binding transcriptional regulator [[Haemophilus] felis]NBI40919.1 LacI family DNA-binding transcriptional regulator [[Haemophilus] felis]OOS07553.1 transcriptional regulator [[Haemophilus] felis]
MPAKRTTLADIARLTGLSTTTVSMILNNRGEQFKIKPETCQRVKQIAQQQGYRANIYAKSLKTQRSNVVGLIIPDLTNYGFACTAKNLEKLCRENDLQLVIACSDDNPQQEKIAIERLLDRQIDFLITAPTHQDPNYYSKIKKQVPLLQLDRYVPNSGLNYVISDEQLKVSTLVGYMINTYELKEFVYFGGQLELSPSKGRLEGFKQGCNAHQEVEQWIFQHTYQPESGYKMMNKAVQQLGHLPQAVFTASYTILEGVLRYISENQKIDAVLQKKMHLATFDDHHLLNALPLHIHSIQQDHQQIAQHLFRLIQHYFNQQKLENCLVDCHIIYRD